MRMFDVKDLDKLPRLKSLASMSRRAANAIVSAELNAKDKLHRQQFEQDNPKALRVPKRTVIKSRLRRKSIDKTY